ncbi:MAG: type II secretion system protein [Planctomycetota bacterium]|jgi:prepilin-type processing-associated H-X9-DG protein/prepilin-type N-terminal cleavage/methylation domain-containing protein
MPGTRRTAAASASAAANTRKRAAFTLVELLVVVGIIALLVTILMPSLGRALELARKTICQTQLHTLGRGWILYWEDNNYKLPQKHNVNRSVPDVGSRFSYMTYCGNPQHTTGRADYVNAGVLYKLKLIGDEKNYVCPTMRKNVGGIWYDNLPKVPAGQPRSRGGGWWPVNRRMGTYTTYNRRRFNYYDDPDLANYGWNHTGPDDFDKRPDAHIMLYITGVNAVTKPGDFSWMADRFEHPGWAMISHVPGVNVLYLDGHVAYWEDPTWDDAKGTGKVLYDNGLASDPGDAEWLHDDIWQIIDGYHKPPVGSGNR